MSTGSLDADDLPPYVVPHSQDAIKVLYEDQDVMVVVKPHLLLSVPGRHPVNRDSLISRLQRRCPEARAVHRLDLDTSGIMVVPKHPSSLSEIARQFQRREVEKEYTAIVWGEIARSTGTINLPIATDWPNRPKQKICHETGKSAVTHFEVIDISDNRSLVRLRPVTGRSHQLRIHMACLGHPILGCDMYAHTEALAASSRLLLHATRLNFKLPTSLTWFSGFAPIPFSLPRSG